MNCFDIHTHHIPLHPEQAILACSIKDMPLPETGIISVGIHPWHLTEKNADEQLHRLEKMVKQPGGVAIGECGMDKLRSTSMDKQIKIFIIFFTKLGIKVSGGNVNKSALPKTF